VSLNPSVTETFFLLGAQDSLLALSYYCNYPKETETKPKVGDLLNPDYEKILALKPDFVIISLPMQKQVQRNLEKLGILWVAFNPESVEEILHMIDSLAVLTGRGERGRQVTDSLTQILSKLKPLKNKPKVYIELSENPIYTVSRRSFISEVFEYAGGINIFSEQGQAYFVPNQEKILEKNPDFIFLLYPGADKKRVEKRLGWENVNAVKMNRIYTLDADLYTRPGPRIFEAVLKANYLLQSCP